MYLLKEIFIHGAFLAGAVLFIVGIKRLAKVRTARRANQLAAIGMAAAMVAAMVGTTNAREPANWLWIVLGILTGSAIGGHLARRVAMTAMPEMVAFLNGMGGAASTLVALAVFFHNPATVGDAIGQISLTLSILIGGVTLSGSLVAYGKLSEKISGNAILLPNRHILSASLAIGILLCGWFAGTLETPFWQGLIYLFATLLALSLGILLVLPIGGADMPVVISLLNSYSGIAAAMTGFVLLNPNTSGTEGAMMLIVSGALVGASGIILTNLMCKAMNRSILNVLTGGFGASSTTSSSGSNEYKSVKSFSAEEAAMLLDGASLVIIVPGYGLAVAQGQHALAELDRLLESRGATVKYAIHPVAGRMPGHMNVLLAEANIPYEKLYELDDINGEFKNANVSIIVGANDVTNPAAINDPKSPIAGMPILNTHESQNVIVIKRSLSPGYAGIKNELFEYDNAMMLFDDAKAALQKMVKELKDN